MTDITKCTWEWCDERFECYRFTCPSHKFSQSYSNFWALRKDKCDFYMPNKKDIWLE